MVSQHAFINTMIISKEYTLAYVLSRCGIFVRSFSYMPPTVFRTSPAVSSKPGGSRHVMTAVIFVLYVMTTIIFAFDWSLVHYSFIEHGDNFWTVNLAFTGLGSTDAAVISAIVLGIAGCISTIVADSAMVCVLISLLNRVLKTSLPQVWRC